MRLVVFFVFLYHVFSVYFESFLYIGTPLFQTPKGHLKVCINLTGVRILRWAILEKSCELYFVCTNETFHFIDLSFSCPNDFRFKTAIFHHDVVLVALEIGNQLQIEISFVPFH